MSTDRLVFFMMDGCGHCEKLKEDGGLYSVLKDDPRVRVVREGEGNTELEKRILDLSGVRSFPQIKLAIGTPGEPPTLLTYNGVREVGPLLSWASQRVEEEPDATRVLFTPLDS